MSATTTTQEDIMSSYSICSIITTDRDDIIADWHLPELAHPTDLDDAIVYVVREYGDDGYRIHGNTIRLLWLPEIGRGAIQSGADPEWSDATDPDDLLRRWSEDAMRN